MRSEQATLFRGLLRELQQSVAPPRTVNKTIIANFRAITEKYQKDDKKVAQDIDNGILFLRSQREYKRLLERYNPLFDLTAEERIEATARRVGFNMPIIHKPE
ncbi:hypothetical protein B0H34DRAFT_689061 [Crassisporium funariophilum]|nr:hypothetical protein B0H34DRAFT_689061 [Crassisporium funariophilum]